MTHYDTTLDTETQARHLLNEMVRARAPFWLLELEGYTYFEIRAARALIARQQRRHR